MMKLRYAKTSPFVRKVLVFADEVGIADRIDLLNDGNASILDYKTGRPPTTPQVRELLAPQLPLEGAILAAGGFPGLGKLATEELLYLHISGSAEGGKVQPMPFVNVAIKGTTIGASTCRRRHTSRSPSPRRCISEMCKIRILCSGMRSFLN